MGDFVLVALRHVQGNGHGQPRVKTVWILVQGFFEQIERLIEELLTAERAARVVVQLTVPGGQALLVEKVHVAGGHVLVAAAHGVQGFRTFAVGQADAGTGQRLIGSGLGLQLVDLGDGDGLVAALAARRDDRDQRPVAGEQRTA